MHIDQRTGKPLYDETITNKILAAYRSIFPRMTPELAEYWGLSRQRKWAVITSDFHSASYDKFKSLHEHVVNIDSHDLKQEAKGEALRAAAMRFGVGYSIGITPWTDHLLYESYSDEKDSVTILLGHDWYPIVTDNHLSGTPLVSTDCLREVDRYWPGAPQAVFDGTTVGLFLNLYPDYRPPGDRKCGSLKGYGYSYDQCLNGLDAVVESLSKRFRTIQLISWGANVWEAVSNRVPAVVRNTLFKNHIENHPGVVLQAKLGGCDVPYLPTYHPSFWPNFGQKQHLYHVSKGFAKMGLGLPGPKDMTCKQVTLARQTAWDGIEGANDTKSFALNSSKGEDSPNFGKVTFSKCTNSGDDSLRGGKAHLPRENHFKAKIFTCTCFTCRAVVHLVEKHGVRLQFSPNRAGRLCELAVVAAAGDYGILEREVVAARRAYAEHLGVVLSGPTSNADTACHIRWAVENSNHNPNSREPIHLGSAIARFDGGRFYLMEAD